MLLAEEYLSSLCLKDFEIIVTFHTLFLFCFPNEVFMDGFNFLPLCDFYAQFKIVFVNHVHFPFL